LEPTNDHGKILLITTRAHLMTAYQWLDDNLPIMFESTSNHTQTSNQMRTSLSPNEQHVNQSLITCRPTWQQSKAQFQCCDGRQSNKEIHQTAQEQLHKTPTIHIQPGGFSHADHATTFTKHKHRNNHETGIWNSQTRPATTTCNNTEH